MGIFDLISKTGNNIKEVSLVYTANDMKPSDPQSRLYIMQLKVYSVKNK